MTYYGPDQAVLLSDVFQNSHCFRVEEGDEDGGTAGWWAGLRAHGAGGPRCGGTLWLDGESRKLRFLEYRYTRYPLPVEDTRNLGDGWTSSAGEAGRWFVGSGAIRMPQMSMDASGGGFAWTGSWRRGRGDRRPSRGGWQIPGLRGGGGGGHGPDPEPAACGGAGLPLGTSHAPRRGPTASFRMEGIRPGRYGPPSPHPRADMMGYRPGLGR